MFAVTSQAPSAPNKHVKLHQQCVLLESVSKRWRWADDVSPMRPSTCPYACPSIRPPLPCAANGFDWLSRTSYLDARRALPA